MRVKTYGINEIPESISVVPCAFSYVTGLKPLVEPSMGGPAVNLYEGQTEVHLSTDVSKKSLGWSFKIHDQIQAACAAHITLQGKVTNFGIDADKGGIEGPVTGTYGSEAPHFAIIVHWYVVVNVTGQFTVGI